MLGSGFSMLVEWEGEAVQGCRLNEVYRERERNLDAISLSNCPKLSDNRRIKTVEYTVVLPPDCPIFALPLQTKSLIDYVPNGRKHIEANDNASNSN